ncbi:MAG: hypothetical protein HOE62_22565, partial [Alphaproteobacteria bacterium]|nr:hypothetical protein [Alphaproteobacteria bacterium]
AADVKSKITDGKWDINKPIPVSEYPFSNDGVLLGHEANYAFMIKAYGIEFSYDMIAKKLLWGANGMDTDTDNAELVLFSRIKSLAALNGLPSNNDAIHTFLPAIAEAKQVNKVRDYLKALEWDGVDRILDLAMAVGPHDVAIGHMSLIRWLVQACAAADGAEIGRKLNPSATAVYEYVLVLHGEQGIGKTKGLQRMVPKALRQYLKESVVLNINNKDSVLQANSSWIAELGELDATFKAADHVAFKAFMSREKDEMRMPYAAKSSKFRRRTVFVGSVNEPEFLKDKTGARRFYPLAVEHGFPEWPDEVVDQLWAQAWSLYATGEQWWPTDIEAGQLGTNAEAFRAKSWAETQLEGTFRWDEALSHNDGDDQVRHTVSEIWLRLQGRPYDRHTSLTPIQMAEVGHGLRRLWDAHGAYMFKGQLSIKTGQGIVRVNATGGRNRGWILPPYIDEYTRMTEAQY